MKKITFLLALLITTIGFSQQTNLENFEGTPVLSGFEGLGGANVVANPSVDGINGSATVGELIVVQAGNPWQGADLVFQGDKLDVTNPVTQTVSVDVYSTSAFTLYAEVSSGVGGAVKAGADEAHGGTGWETLTFTFNEALNGTSVANGAYGKMSFFPNWNGSGWHDPEIERTIYIDNITGDAVTTTPDPEPATAAPVPTTGNATVYSFYNDTNNYTTTFPFVYPFGSATDVDLDPTDAVNNALKVDTNNDGYGNGEGGPDDISDYDFVNFNYWFSNTKGTPGFVFILIDNDGAVQEFSYQIGSVGAGDSADVVSETWTQVSIPMSHFTNLGFDDTALFQWKVDKYGQSGDNGGFLYLDNFVLTKGNPLSRNEFTAFESTVSPNPTSNTWNISTRNNTIQSVELFNLLGSRVYSKKNNSSDISIPSQGLSSGIYIAKVTTEVGTKTMKLIKE